MQRTFAAKAVPGLAHVRLTLVPGAQLSVQDVALGRTRQSRSAESVLLIPYSDSSFHPSGFHVLCTTRIPLDGSDSCTNKRTPLEAVRYP